MIAFIVAAGVIGLALIALGVWDLHHRPHAYLPYLLVLLGLIYAILSALWAGGLADLEWARMTATSWGGPW